MDKILTASDFAKVAGFKDAREMMRARTAAIYDTPPVEGEAPPVVARVDFGRWLADCECGGAELIDPADPFFYCYSCGNFAHGGIIRPVIVPDGGVRDRIEALLLQRPVKTQRGRNALERAAMAVPAIVVEGKGPLSRSWNPDETTDDLKEQNKVIKKGRR